MITTGSVSPQHMIALMESHTSLTPEQLDVLKTEISGDPEAVGYAEADAAEKLRLINIPYTKENPDAQGRVPRTTVPQDEYIILINRIILRGDQLTGAAAEVWRKVKSAAEGMRFQLSVNLEDPDVQLGISVLTQLGLLALQDGETVSLGDLLLTRPDPNWLGTLSYESRAEVLFGLGAVVELDDLEAVL